MRITTWIKKNMMLILPTKQWIKIDYFFHYKSKCNLVNPKTYGEKLAWLKIYYHDKRRIKLVDKYDVREIISKKIGEEYLIPLLGVWNRYEEIDFGKLPNQFVLKPTHTSGNVYICKDKSKIDHDELKKLVKKWLKIKYYNQGREWEYKFLTPRIIAEKYMVDESKTELKDYKFFCFNGEPKVLFVATDRNKETKFDFFDLEFKHLPIKNGHQNSTVKIKEPKNFDKMIEISKILSKDFPHVRVDLYNINGKIYFGELTFYHFGGIVPFEPEKWNYVFGEWLTLPQKIDNKKEIKNGI